MADAKTIRIYTEDWARLAEWQAARGRRTGERPSFADLIREALNTAQAWVGDLP